MPTLSDTHVVKLPWDLGHTAITWASSIATGAALCFSGLRVLIVVDLIEGREGQFAMMASWVLLAWGSLEHPANKRLGDHA